MAEGTALETLLRSTGLVHGRIALDRLPDGSWGAVVCHFGGRATMTHHMGDYHDDPVDALRTALAEDDRKARDVARRYEAAPKLGPAPAPAAIDVDDVLG